jgi:hypothetical protein
MVTFREKKFLEPSLEHCMHCGAHVPQANYTAHRWAINAGPELPLCDACGEESTPTLDEINLKQWKLIPDWWPCWVAERGELRVARYGEVKHLGFVMGFGVLALSEDTDLQVEPCDVSLDVALRWDAPKRQAEARRILNAPKIVFTGLRFSVVSEQPKPN